MPVLHASRSMLGDEIDCVRRAEKMVEHEGRPVPWFMDRENGTVAGLENILPMLYNKVMVTVSSHKRTFDLSSKEQ